MKIEELIEKEKKVEKHPVELKDVKELLWNFLGREIDNFYIYFNNNKRATVNLRTTIKYIRKNNGKHPYEKVAKQITKHYYKYGKATVVDAINRGFYKKD